MWKPNKLVIKGLGPHINTEYIFNNGRVTYIKGKNLDDDGQESNGSGKSIPGEALHIALTGEIIRKGIRISELVNDNYNQATIIFTLKNDFLKREMEIERIISKSTSQKVKVNMYDLSNDRAPIENKLSGVEAFNKYIFEMLDITKEDLTNYYIITKTTYKPFFTIGDNDKKLFISRFSGADLLKGIDKHIEADLKPFDEKIKNIETKIQVLSGKNEVLTEEMLKHSKDEFKKELEAKIKEIDIKINLENQNKLNIDKDIKFKIEEQVLREKNKVDIAKKIEELNPQKKTYQEDKLKYENEILELEKLKIESDVELKIFTTKQSEVKLKKNELVDIKTNISRHLNNISECPKCNHKYSLLDSTKDLAVVEGSIKKIDLLIKNQSEVEKDLNNEFAKFELDVLDIKKELKLKEDSYRKIKLNYTSLEQNIMIEEGKIKSLDINITDNKTSIESKLKLIESKNNLIQTYQLEKDSISEKHFEDKTKEYQNKINLNNEEKDKHTLEIESIRLEKESKQKWISLFKSFNTYLVNKSLGIVEGYINMYLKEMNSNLSISIEGYKLLADGITVRDEIETFVLKNGVTQGSYGRYSGGERGRIDVASILTFQKIKNLNSKYGGLELLHIDEALDSIDSLGMDLLVKSLDKLGKTIEIITHANNNIIGVKNLTWVKQNSETKEEVL